ncbi:MAG: type III pantothenate kinase [Candidatus Omnitrophica bacterium]|nr:type III pantothenate kinase [Candidatus Omnitrophota bacterium]
MKNRKSLIIAIDVGNTNISIGLFRKSVLKSKISIATRSSRPVLRRHLMRLKHLGAHPDAIIICSVVPDMNKVLSFELRKILKVKPVFCGEDLIVPIKNLYKHPESVGQDRLVTAYAAARFYGQPLIILDFGTAVTIEAVSKGRAYLGGIITPGLKISLEALSQKTALLPSLSLSKKPAKLPLIGRTTSQSIYSGLFFGFSCMIKELIKEVKKKIGKNAKVAATGGDIKIIRRFLAGSIDIVDEDLTLKALNLLAQI